MFSADSYEHILGRLDNFHRGKAIWMCGLLFARPTTQVGQSIMADLNYWHRRSGDNVDIFCVGYIDRKLFDTDKPVSGLTERGTHTEFYYSAEAFNDIRGHVSQNSSDKWDYSGEADLLLVNAVRGFSECSPRSTLELDEIVKLDVDAIVQDRIYASASRLMESVCKFAEDAVNRGRVPDPMDFRSREFIRTFCRGQLDTIIRLLKLEAPLLSAKHFLQ